MKRVLLSGLALIVLLTAGSLFAQPPGMRGNMPPAPGMMGTMPPAPNVLPGALLGLSAEQQTAIAKLRLEHQKMAAPLRAEVQSLRTTYRLMLIDSKVSESKLKSQFAKISAKRQALALLQAKHQRAVRNLLTDEQKVKFDQRILSGHGRRGCMGHKGGMMKSNGRMPGRRMR